MKNTGFGTLFMPETSSKNNYLQTSLLKRPANTLADVTKIIIEFFLLKVNRLDNFISKNRHFFIKIVFFTQLKQEKCETQKKSCISHLTYK